MENHATYGLRTLNTELSWYCGRVVGGRERLFARMLHRFGIETYLPVTTKKTPSVRTNDRNEILHHGTITREVPLFPGYVFVALDDYGWARTRSIEVARKPQWLDFGNGPVQIPIELITELRQREQNGFIQTVALETYHEGDELEVIDGVFRGWRGILSSDPDERILTLHMIAESDSLQPTQLIKTVQVFRIQTRRALV